MLRLVDGLPGVVTRNEAGPRPTLMQSLDQVHPARHLTVPARKYFIGELDPCASIEFTRGCPWDCTFCSAWTFYGRSYRKSRPCAGGRRAGAGSGNPTCSSWTTSRSCIPNTAWRSPTRSSAGIRKRFYIETRCDVLIRNEEVFRRGRTRACVHVPWSGVPRREPARSVPQTHHAQREFPGVGGGAAAGIQVAINLITDASWSEEQFDRAISGPRTSRRSCTLPLRRRTPAQSSFTPESRKLATLDYRLFDIQHAVLPTRLPLDRFYEKLVESQSIINRKFMGWRTLLSVSNIVAGQLAREQTNFLRMLFKFSRVYNAKRQFADHQRPVQIRECPPGFTPLRINGDELSIHTSKHSRPAHDDGWSSRQSEQRSSRV